MSRRPLRIGLTGPIGCGKSTIARWLAERGGAVIDADIVARQASAPDAPTLPRIRARFGDSAFSADGSLDRAALGRIVFSDARALHDLEVILHPAIRTGVLAELAAAEAAGAPFVTVEAIKLVEGGLATICDEVWLVTCGPDVQRARLAARGVAAADVAQRLAAQGPDLAERLRAAASRIIDTDGPLEATRRAVDVALAEALARRGRP